MNQKQARAAWETEGEDRSRAVARVFESVAPSYDAANRVMSLNQDNRWRKALVAGLELQPGQQAVDYCTGTGQFLPILREAVGESGEVHGLDFSDAMLSEARKLNLADVVLGDAMNPPYVDKQFDAATMGWGLRNIPDPAKALSEVHRTLKVGGKFGLIDCVQVESKFLNAVTTPPRRLALPLLGRVLGKTDEYRYLAKSMERFMNRTALIASFELAGFSDIRTRQFMLGNICLVWGTKK